MASIFSKNGVLSGHIDHYCLICAQHFTNEEDTLAHIVDTQHKQKLESCGYFEKYKEDFIRKAQGIYFCEPCNLTFPTATKVELHKQESSHIIEKEKITPQVKRVGNDIVAFNRYIISDDAWNGCIGDTCFLCNIEFEDSGSHKTLKSHVLNLMKSEVIFDKLCFLTYRTIDDKSKQCLTCNKIIGNDLGSHYVTGDHNLESKLYDPRTQTNETKTTTECSKTAEAAKTDHNQKADSNVVNGNDKGDLKNDKKSLKDDVAENKKGIKKTDATNTNKDVKKNATTDAKKDSKKENTKLNDKEKVKAKRSDKKENAEELDKIYCKNLGAKNYITSGIGDKWCVLCEWLLDESPEDHIRSKHHQNLLKAHKERLAEKNNNVSSEGEESSIYESVDKYQNSNVNIDLINETAFCKKCSKNIDFNTLAIDKHIEGHKKTTTSKKAQETLSSGIKSNGTDKTTLFTKPVLLDKDKRSRKTMSVGDFAKTHGLAHNRADGSYYCHPCSRRLPSVLDDLQKHIASKIHTENTKESPIAPPPKKVNVPVNEFIKSFGFVQHFKEVIMVINDKYWLNSFSFFLISKNMREKILCHGCQIDLTEENVMEHIGLNENHRAVLEKSSIITSLEDDFIREITLNVFHCSFCNCTVNDWEDVLDHVTMEEHKREKSKAEQLLKEHLPYSFDRVDVTEVRDMMNRFARYHRY